MLAPVNNKTKRLASFLVEKTLLDQVESFRPSRATRLPGPVSYIFSPMQVTTNTMDIFQLYI